jgi:hypothetical protein
MAYCADFRPRRALDEKRNSMKKFRVVLQKKVILRSDLVIEAESQFEALTKVDAMIKNNEAVNVEWATTEYPIKAFSVHDE